MSQFDISFSLLHSIYFRLIIDAITIKLFVQFIEELNIVIRLAYPIETRNEIVCGDWDVGIYFLEQVLLAE